MNSPSSDIPSSKTPPDDIELSPGAANENDERFICGELMKKTNRQCKQMSIHILELTDTFVNIS